jgi:hypothetical protein
MQNHFTGLAAAGDPDKALAWAKKGSAGEKMDYNREIAQTSGKYWTKKDIWLSIKLK